MPDVEPDELFERKPDRVRNVELRTSSGKGRVNHGSVPVVQSSFGGLEVTAKASLVNFSAYFYLSDVSFASRKPAKLC